MTSKDKTIAILGAAGRIGDAAARAFVEAGWTVRGVGRNARISQMAPGVEPVSADAHNLGSLTAACEGADVILNALNPEYDDWGKVLPMARNVIATAEAVGATHLLPGNVYNFGHDIAIDTAENASEVPSTKKAEIRIAMEKLFREADDTKGVQTIVLRAGDFYGGGKPGSWLDGLIMSKLQKNVFTWPGPANLPHAFAYLPDLGRAFVAVAEKRNDLAQFERLHFTGHTLTGDEMHRITERAVGRTLKRAGVPWPLLRAVGLVKPLYREIAIMSYLWRTAHSLDGSKFERLIGPFEVTKPEDAIAQAITDLELDGPAKIAA